MTAAITDFTQFSGLRAGAERNDPAVLREVSGQFEALFLQTMLKSMREASLGDPLFGTSNQHEMYQGMLDQQLALEMSSGKGIGLADMLVRQLGGESTTPRSASHASRITASPGAEVSVLKPNWSDAKAFANDVWPHVKRAARRLNVTPIAILAQAALETGWGAHVPQRSDGSSSFNLFGIKAGKGWSGDSAVKPTLEFEAGVARPELAKFRAYKDVGANFDDYSKMLSQNPRYASVSDHGDDVDGFASALQSSGYATDPAYADKLKRVISGATMQRVLGGLKTLATRPTMLISGQQSAGSR